MTPTPPQPPQKPPSQPAQPPRTFLGAITQAVRTVQAKVNFSQLVLKPNARVPELWVQDANATKAEVYPLLGEHYLLGRSSKSCDIVVRNPVISQVHMSLTRDKRQGDSSFVLKDENSTNGIYRGKKRLTKLALRHGDILSLGPPELATSVRVQFHNPPPWYVRALRYGLYGFTGVTACGALYIGYEWQRFTVRPLPVSVQGPVVVTARDGTTLLRPVENRAHTEKRQLSEFSSFLPKAIVASEDERYNWHFGVDPLGITRALLTNLREGEIREGGSTITQQLARSIFREYVGTEDSTGRKLREAIVALKLETVYSKDFLMLTYLNRVYLGNSLYGFEDAAQFYFAKSAKDLDLSEAATLVGILPAPNRFNPVQDYETAVQYRDRVINNMARQGMVTMEEAQSARRSRININPAAVQELQSTIAPYFYGQIFTELEALLGSQLAQEGNFIVESSLDTRMQALAENSLKNAIATNGAAGGYSEGALVTLNSSTGEVLAMVGGADYSRSQFNRASQALRQPGSTFKVFAYTAALEQGISPGTPYSCAPLFWQGQSYDGCRSGGGSVDFYSGMAQSENAVALRVAQDVGLDRVAQMAKRLGITSELNPVPGLVLGQSEVTVLDMTGAFGVLANQGVRIPPHTINRILDGNECADERDRNTCREIYNHSRDAKAGVAVISPEVANTMTTLLQGVVQSGTGRRAAIGQGEAGKTGTTNDNVDLWYVGYIPSSTLTTGIWFGNDDNTPTGGNSGDAAQLWGDYMRQAVQ
ncbi:MAG: transglycosylase domain-containing protein [Oculatellaceae cyanobacterium Prado106]|jgi:membrane peptidoglycan carboxypeptidase|nr:transglycosylase domain-containing protein [Oculatellaceae cyanobacterium Prado106]